MAGCGSCFPARVAPESADAAAENTGASRDPSECFPPGSAGLDPANDPERVRASQAAVDKGRELYRLAARSFSPAPDEEDLAQIGGRDGCVRIFANHYRRLFSDPRMLVLFDTRDPDSNVSAEEHGKRLGLFLLYRWERNTEYLALRGRRMFAQLSEAHQRAKSCPLRAKKLHSRGFTLDQRNAWLGHLWFATGEAGMSTAVQDKLARHLASVIDFYAPWVDSTEA